jgi:prepilin-type N-terminal cleavage/methylation domain-containing protein
MKSDRRRAVTAEKGFTLIELTIAVLIMTVISGAIFMLLRKGQDSFGRESEVADLNQSARVGLDRMSRDLMMAGYRTPPAMAITWVDGGGINPDQLTIVYAEDNVPLSNPLKCGDSGGCVDNSNSNNNNNNNTGGGGGPCKTIEMSSTLRLDPCSIDPELPKDENGVTLTDYAQNAYTDEMILFAIETEDCNGDGQVGAFPFEVTQPPKMGNAGGGPVLQINHNPGHGDADINRPGGFNRAIEPDCAVIGLFRVVQYRINPLPPAANPMLERRDLSTGEPWTPVSANIENLQVQYGVGNATTFVDVPAQQPNPEDPSTWITRVRVTIGGRSESTNLQGASAGVFDAGDTHIRKTFSTVVSLRNQVYSAAEKTDLVDYN